MKISRRRLLDLLIVGSALAGLVVAISLALWNRAEENLWKQDYSLIEDGLYMGGYVDEPPAGTTAVLNLSEAEDAYQCEVHVWKGIRDGPPAPTLKWLRKAVEFVDEQRHAGKTTYVHCFAGVSRSAMVVTAYFMFKNRWSRDQALEFVRTKRPSAKPNRAFMELLLEWERALKI